MATRGASESKGLERKHHLPPSQLEHKDHRHRVGSPSSERRDTMSSSAGNGTQPTAGTGLYSYAVWGLSWICQSLGNVVNWLLSFMGVGASSSAPVVPFADRSSQLKVEMKQTVGKPDAPFQQMQILFRVAMQWKDPIKQRQTLFGELVAALRPESDLETATGLETELATKLKQYIFREEAEVTVETLLGDLAAHLWANATDGRPDVLNVLQGVYFTFAAHKIAEAKRLVETQDPAQQISGLRLLRACVPYDGLDAVTVTPESITVEFRALFKQLTPQTLKFLTFSFTQEINLAPWREAVDAQLVATRDEMTTRDRFTGVGGFAAVLETAVRDHEGEIQELAFTQFLETLTPDVLDPIRTGFYDGHVELQGQVSERLVRFVEETDRTDEAITRLLEKALFSIPAVSKNALRDLANLCRSDRADLRARQETLRSVLRYSEFSTAFFNVFKDQEMERVFQTRKGEIEEAVAAKTGEIGETLEQRRKAAESGFDEEAVRGELTSAARLEAEQVLRREIEAQFNTAWLGEELAAQRQHFVAAITDEAMVRDRAEHLALAAEAAHKTV